MKDLDREFVGKRTGTGVILSPRALKKDQLERHAGEIRAAGGAVLFDPQFYQPRTDHQKILSFPYWEDLDFSTSEFDPADFCRRVIDYQRDVVGVDELILPGRYANAATGEWRDMQAGFAECARGLDRPVYATLAVGSDLVNNGEAFDAVLDDVLSYPVDGIYLLACRPRNQFYAQDKLFLYALLDGCLSLVRSGKRIIVGYANQQFLMFAAAGVTCVASGNFRNVRHFNPDIFATQEGDISQRATWYYDGWTLGEYRVQAMALHYRRGHRRAFGPECEYCRPLLEAENPAGVVWGERDAFRHFLHELGDQWLSLASLAGGGERAESTVRFFASCTERGRELEQDGFQLGERAFSGPVADATIGALQAFRQDRAADLRLLGA
jgi:hypothetical protein